MEIIAAFIDIILHLDAHLAALIEAYGTWIYVILFVIVFCETGLVVTPFLPGDSLLFVAGTLAAAGGLDLVLLVLILLTAAILGDTVNYWIGQFIGEKAFERESRFFKKAHLEKTRNFYARHGGKTIIIARFVPIVRTFAPFVAGIGRMHYPRFLAYNVTGALLWVFSLVLGGYFFGNLPVIKDNLTVVILTIIFVSLLPMVFHLLRGEDRSA